MTQVEELAYDVEVVGLLASRRHRYEGRPSDGPAPAEDGEVRERVEVRAGLGIVGDRYFGRRAHAHAAVTLVDEAAVVSAARRIGVVGPVDPLVTRRNVVLRGIEVDRLVGSEVVLDCGEGEVRLAVRRPARPCGWMDQALGPGGHRALRGHGGVRCEPLSDGVLRLGPAVLRTRVDLATLPL
ncbi:MOSC domain-containing protein [Solicola sp. PLA-1-18]|uniref:MOSC domain-containing protein n=1 Tax=Solicola sp. PLA-1-18 TaxID=3380532 RepID=UPI003B7A8374